MRVRMRIAISGNRNGQPWPKPGEEVDLPDAEAASLCAQRLADVVETPVETAVPEPAEHAEPEPVEVTKPPEPAKRGPGRPRKNPPKAASQ